MDMKNYPKVIPLADIRDVTKYEIILHNGLVFFKYHEGKQIYNQQYDGSYFLSDDLDTPSTLPPNRNINSEYTSLSSSSQIQNVTKTSRKTLQNEGLEGSGITDAKRIRDWIEGTSGYWTTDELDRELGFTTSTQKNNRRLVLFRLKGEFIEQNPRQNKSWRRIDKDLRIIDFKQVSKRNPINIKLPLGIEKYVNIYSRNIIVLAGTSNAGKTAWMLNFIKMNQTDYEIDYFSSEMGEDELANRLEKFGDITLDDWTFKAIERSSNFSDGINPDSINLIDYLEISKDFSEVADQIRAIHDNLKTGICIIALQKNPGVDLGRGGTFSLEKARLYLAMDSGKTTIVKAKNWVNPELNPNKLMIKYKILDGCKFVVTEDWRKAD